MSALFNRLEAAERVCELIDVVRFDSGAVYSVKLDKKAVAEALFMWEDAKEQSCKTCHGSGVKEFWDDWIDTCPTCKGIK